MTYTVDIEVDVGNFLESLTERDLEQVRAYVGLKEISDLDRQVKYAFFVANIDKFTFEDLVNIASKNSA